LAADFIVNTTVVISLVFWGAWGVFDKKALNLGSPVLQLVTVYLCAPLMVLCALVTLPVIKPDWHLSAHTLFYGLLSSLSYFVATAAYLVAMARKDASLIIGITACYPVVSQVLAVLVLGEPFVIARFAGCLILVAGVVALSRSGNSGNRSKEEIITGNSLLPVSPRNSGAVTLAEPVVAIRQNNHAAVALANSKSELMLVILAVAIAVIGWSARGIFDKLALGQAHPAELFLTKYLIDTVLGLITLFVLLLKVKPLTRTQLAFVPFSMGSAVCLAAGSAGYYVALSMAQASYVVAITGCYPLVLYFLALIFLKEKFKPSRILGLVLITFGGIITQLAKS
jgi:drug/metabolite transporter (DMT)-like permease